MKYSLYTQYFVKSGKECTFAAQNNVERFGTICSDSLQPQKKMLKVKFSVLILVVVMNPHCFKLLNSEVIIFQYMSYLFTSESVSEGHPDKVADQISDAILDRILAFDKDSKVACETLVTTGQVVIAGEIKSKAYVDLQETARNVINRIGYTKGEYMFDGNSCGVLSAIHEQSADINRGVEREDPIDQGAGDQGMMFGYATNETDNYMPLPLHLAHTILRVLAEIRREGTYMTYLRPDSKSQVTIEYNDNGTPERIDTIVVSTQHDDFIQPANDSKEAALKADEEMLAIIRKDVVEILMPRVIEEIGNADALQ